MKAMNEQGQYFTDDEIIKMALAVLSHRFNLKRTALNSPRAVRDYLTLAISEVPHEVFYAAFLDAQNRVIALEELFRGTLTQTSVYPREVVKAALKHNAAAIIFAHNHPSGVAEPSRADESLTQALKQALALVDVKVLDHFVIGAGTAMSFAEKGAAVKFTQLFEATLAPAEEVTPLQLAAFRRHKRNGTTPGNPKWYRPQVVRPFKPQLSVLVPKIETGQQFGLAQRKGTRMIAPDPFLAACRHGTTAGYVRAYEEAAGLKAQADPLADSVVRKHRARRAA